MAQCLEVYCGGDGAKASGGGKGSNNYKVKTRKKITWQIKWSSSRGTVQVVQVVKKQRLKKGKGGSGSGGKKTKREGQRYVECHNCGRDHFEDREYELEVQNLPRRNDLRCWKLQDCGKP